MTFPAYLDAIRGGLSGTALEVYLRLSHDYLNDREYRPVKQLALAYEMHYSLVTVARGIAECLAKGYILRGPTVVGEPRSYRLVYSRDVTSSLAS